MTTASWLESAARAHPERPAVARGRAVIRTQRELAGSAAAIAGWLWSLGLAPGARVGVFSENLPEYVEILFGIWWAGYAAAPINAKLASRELAWILEDAGCEVCFAGPKAAVAALDSAPACLRRMVVVGSWDYAQALAHPAIARVSTAANALAWLFYTSGTTGRPKGAMLSHSALESMALSYLAEVDATRPNDVLLHAAPMSHGSGMYMIPTVARAGVNVVPETGAFDPAEIFDLAAHWRRVSMFAAPTMLRRMVKAGTDFDPFDFRTIVYGGGPMYVADAMEARARFPGRLAQIYGQGEFPMSITRLSRHDINDRRHPDWATRLASVGRPFLKTRLEIHDPNGAALPAGEVGEVCVAGDAAMLGYWRNPDATAATMTDGWLRTDDLGDVDGNGFLTLRDRSKDVVISGGSNIYPREVEETLLTHPEVEEASVIGRRDPDWGEVVVAYYAGAATPESLDAHCRDQIARFKRPKAYVRVEALPKNAYGKIAKRVLRDLDAGRAEPRSGDGRPSKRDGAA